jgi:hypothetical protein
MLLEGTPGKEMPGVESESLWTKACQISRVKITTPRGCRKTGQSHGHIHHPGGTGPEEEGPPPPGRVSQVLARELALMGMEKEAGKTVLVVGLGNWNVTPMPWAPGWSRGSW